MRPTRLVVGFAAAALLAGSSSLAVPTATAHESSAHITTRVVQGGIKTTLRRGTTGGSEVKPGVGEAATGPREPVANRSQSSRAKSSRGGPGLSGIPADSTPVANASGATSFSGIDHFTQRYSVAGGNQWSLEPPDQGLCVGNGFVFEAVNNAVAVYDESGNRLALDALNHFYGYGYEIDRSIGQAGPKQTTDPSCLYDPTTGRFYLTILTYDSDTAGNPVSAGTNTIDIAVSDTSDPIGTWTITHIDVTDDGSNGTPDHPNCPCLGDYPHIGVDANGFYVTTNEYPWFVDGFNGAQIYAMSKAELASGATSVTVTQIDTARSDPNGNPGFTIWPAQSPTTGDYETAAGGTEYFLSTNAAAEANGSGSSEELLTWSLTNTSSLDTNSPNLHLRVVSSAVDEYAVPLPADQKAGPVPLADCLNLTACAKIALGRPDKYKESERPLDSLDARMQQVSFANGRLYGAHGTAVDVGDPAVQKAGIVWYITQPATASNGNLSTTVLHEGRLANAGNNVVMPALGARADGSAVIAFTLAGADHYPSAAYVDLAADGTTSSIYVLAAGVGPEDGFAGYRGFGGRPRWGDYGAAAVDASGNLWVASEWIGQSCSFSQYLASPIGQCGGTRTLLANWSTQISEVAAP